MMTNQSMPYAARPALHVESKTDASKILNATLLLAIFVPAYYWFRGGATIFLGFLALILSVLVVKYIQLILNKQPHLLLNENGISWHHWPCGTVRWLDVKRVYCMHWYSSDYLCFELFNESAYLKKQSFLRRFAKPIGVPFFSIPVGFLDRNPADLYEIITAEIQMRRAQQRPVNSHHQ
jgi:hypothetical protein